jgi:hypothetical protein
LALEALLALCQDPHLLFALFSHYDLALDAPNDPNDDDDGDDDGSDRSDEARAAGSLLASPSKRRPSADARAAVATAMAAAAGGGSNLGERTAPASGVGASAQRRRPVGLISNLVAVVAHFLASGTASEGGLALLVHGLKRLATAQPQPQAQPQGPSGSGSGGNGGSGLLVGFGGAAVAIAGGNGGGASRGARVSSGGAAEPTSPGGPLSKHHLRARQATFAGSHSVKLDQSLLLFTAEASLLLSRSLFSPRRRVHRCALRSCVLIY